MTDFARTTRRAPRHLTLAAVAATTLFASPFADADTNGTWTQLPHTSTTPVDRREHVAVYDAQRDRYVMFAGWNFLSPHPSGLFREVRALELGDEPDWLDETLGNDGPGERHSPQWGYDAARQVVVLFGGGTSNARFNDTWEWDGTSWQRKFPLTVPLARAHTAMTYDASRKRVVMFGGRDSSNLLFDDTWEWDGANWRRLTLQASPSARWLPVLAYDGKRKRVVLHGGIGPPGAPALRDTWELVGSTWTDRCSCRCGPRCGTCARCPRTRTRSS